MTRQYSMNQTLALASQGSADIERWLTQKPWNVAVDNVENIEEYQGMGIDLLWTYQNKKEEKKTLSLEIKVDQYFHTGNYFLETLSNVEKGTLGCILYSKADYLMYYFLDVKELHIIPMGKLQIWFSENMELFAERKTSTSIGSRKVYDTAGRLVPREQVSRNVKGIKIKNIVETSL